MSERFVTESEAEEFFEDVDVEQCECCGLWTASAADHTEGAIIGPCVDNDGTGEIVVDRICDDCDLLEIEDIRSMAEEQNWLNKTFSG